MLSINNKSDVTAWELAYATHRFNVPCIFLYLIKRVRHYDPVMMLVFELRCYHKFLSPFLQMGFVYNTPVNIGCETSSILKIYLNVPESSTSMNFDHK